MQTQPQYIANGMVVSLAYTLTVDGEEIAQATAAEPMDYLHGAQEILPGLENALTGKRVGDKLSLTLTPDQAYGEFDDENFEEVERADIPDADDLEIGMVLEVEDEEGEVFMASVSEIDGDTVILDFNPPLAGKTLTYDVEVVDMRVATDEELEHGHAHGSGAMHDDILLDDEGEWDEDDEEWEDEDEENAADAPDVTNGRA